jgi:hypothetical protein
VLEFLPKRRVRSERGIDADVFFEGGEKQEHPALGKRRNAIADGFLRSGAAFRIADRTFSKISRTSGEESAM